MAELTEEQLFELVSGGDCHLHSHSFDRVITHDQVIQYQDSETLRVVTSTRSLSYDDDYLFVNTTSGALSLTLPIARGGKLYVFTRTAGASNLTLLPTGTDQINGSASLVISTSYAPVRLKALKGVGWVQV